MPRRKSLVTVIRDLVRDEVTSAISSLLGAGKEDGERASPAASAT
jgi:hypothetical protein